MRINYINEGYFKSPDKMKAELDKNKQSSAAELLAKKSNEVLAAPIKRCLQTILDDIDIFYPSIIYTRAVMNDIFEIGLDAIVPIVMQVNSSFKLRSWKYAQETATVTNIDYSAKKISIDIEIGNINPSGTNALDISESVIPIRVDYLFNEVLPASKNTEYYLKNYLIHEFFTFRDNECTDEYKRCVKFCTAAEYDINIKWNLQQDIIFFPIFSTDVSYLNEYKSRCLPSNANKEEIMDKINGKYYSFTKYIFHEDAWPVENPKITWKKFSAGHQNWITEQNCTSFEAIAKQAKTYFEKIGITNINGHHLYLSTGYLDKDYLIM